MRTRRLLLGAAILVGIIVVTLVVVRPSTPRPKIDETAFGRIKPGMTLAEVEALIGGPPGNYFGQDAWALYSPVGPLGMRGWERQQWIGETSAVSVSFHQGEVSQVRFGTVYATAETLPKKLRRWCREWTGL